MKYGRLFILFALSLFAAVSCCEKDPVVNYKLYYGWNERCLPDFSTLGEPDVQGTKINLDLVDIPDTANHFAVLFETVLKVPAEEEYTFKVSSDDGTKVYIDGELLIENDGAHGPILKIASKMLSKGAHDLRVEYFDCDKGQSLDFRYYTPTIALRELNPNLEKYEYNKALKHGYVKPQVKEALKRYKEWKGDDETVCFPILTDVHTAGRYSYLHVGYAAVAGDMFGADFMVNLGDIGLNAYPATTDAEYAKSVVDNTVAQMKKWDGMWLYAAGNHDWDAGEGAFNSEAFLSDTFQKPWLEKSGGNLHLTPGKVYCYYDIPGKGLRVILLNSSGTGTQGGCYYIFDEEQMLWLEDLLTKTPEGTDVLVMTHYMPHPQGRWTTSNPPAYTLESNERLMNILSDYYATGRGLVGLITGDAHVNMHAVRDGVNYFISQGYGWVVDELMLEGTRHAYFDYKETLCIDVVAIKPVKKEVRTFRIGAGGADYDYAFNY